MQTTQLTTSELGAAGMQITPVGFGAWALGGGGWQFGWGPQADDESVAAIHRAIDLGINWIDTAAAYGFGHSERIVGHAVAGLGDARPWVFTKCSLLDDPAALYDDAITGFRRVAQVDPILAAVGLELSGEDVAQIESAGLR
jgi:aryl-alcohol dehydrogenase-like predicted oxidoreductase